MRLRNQQLETAGAGLPAARVGPPSVRSEIQPERRRSWPFPHAPRPAGPARGRNWQQAPRQRQPRWPGSRASTSESPRLHLCAVARPADELQHVSQRLQQAEQVQTQILSFLQQHVSPTLLDSSSLILNTRKRCAWVS